MVKNANEVLRKDQTTSDGVIDYQRWLDEQAVSNVAKQYDVLEKQLTSLLAAHTALKNRK